MDLKIDLNAFLEAGAQAGIGLLQGRMAGEEALRQRQAQEYAQLLQATQLRQQQQQGEQADIFRALQYADPDSQARLLGKAFESQDPFTALRESPWVKRRPDLMRIYGQQPTGAPTLPATPAAGVAAPDTRPGFRVPGVAQPIRMKGFDPNDAARVMQGLDKSLGDMRNIVLTDPLHIKARQEYFDQRSVLGQIDSPEKLQQANTMLQNVLNFQSAVGGPQRQRFEEQQLQSDITDYEIELEKGMTGLDDLTFASALPGHLQTEESIRGRRGKRGYGGKGLKVHAQDIAEVARMLAAGDTEGAARIGREIRGRISSRITPQQEQRAQTNVLQMIGKLNPRSITPDVVRTIYGNAGIGYLVEGLPDEALRLGGSALEKTWTKNFDILTNPKRWAGLPKEARKAVLEEISGAAAVTGRNIDLPADVVLEMSPLERAKLLQNKERLRLTGRQVDIASARLRMEKDKFDWQKAHPEVAGGKAGALTQNAKAQAYRKVWEKSWADYNRLSGPQGLKMTVADFDPMNPDMKDSDQVALSRAYKAALAAGNQYKSFLKTQGVDIDVNIGVAGGAPTVIKPPPAGGKPGAPPGQPTPTAPPPAEADKRYNITMPGTGKVYRNVTKREFRDNLIKAKASPAEVNAILRMIWPEGGTGGGTQPGR